MSAPIRIAFLLSGSGTTLENLFRHVDMGVVKGSVVVVVSDKAGVLGLDRARARGVPAAVVERKAYRDVEAFSAAIEAAIRPHAPDLVVMGGFLSLWRVPSDWKGRVLNVHPSLIPAFCGKGFYGERVHRTVLEAGVKVTGCTVHFVDDEFDHGPIVAQAAVFVEDADTPETLAHRVQDAERRLYPACIRLFQEGRLAIDGRRVRVLPGADRTSVTAGGASASISGPARESAAIAAAGPRLKMPAPKTAVPGKPIARASDPCTRNMSAANTPGGAADRVRARVRALAREALAVGRPTDWFERLYREADGDTSVLPWADLAPNAELAAWAARPHVLHAAKTAVVVGCGLGHDAEFLAGMGLDVTAFDVSPTAIEWAKKLHPGSPVRYEVQDLFAMPEAMRSRFDLVVEIYTLQALPFAVRGAAATAIRDLVAPGGTLFVYTRLRDDGPEAPQLVEAESGPPWPLGRRELDRITESLAVRDALVEAPDSADPAIVRAHGTWRHV